MTEGTNEVQKDSDHLIDIQCPVCKHEFKYDVSRIPYGEKYEVRCEKCGILMLRKRLGRL